MTPEGSLGAGRYRKGVGEVNLVAYDLLEKLVRASAKGRPLKRLVITHDQLLELRAEFAALRYYDLPKSGLVGHLWGVELYVRDNLIAAAQEAADTESDVDLELPGEHAS